MNQEDIDMLDPADPPSPLTLRAALLGIIEDLMQSMDWVGTGDQRSGDLYRAEYQARIDAALASSPAPAGLDVLDEADRRIREGEPPGSGSDEFKAGWHKGVSHSLTAVARVKYQRSLASSPAPDAELRAAAADVLARFGGYGRGYWSDEDEDALVALRAALASSPAPAGLDVDALPGVRLDPPHIPAGIEHDEGCAYAYGNLTYSCSCLVTRESIRAATRPAEDVPVDLGEGRALQKLSDALRPAEDAEGRGTVSARSSERP